MRINAIGLAKANEIYKNRQSLIQDYKNEGKKVIGYLCAFAPPELITAAGLIPYRITGNSEEPITEADECFETIMCPYVRNCFDQALKGAGAGLDGIVMSHSCDSVLRVSGLWDHLMKPPYFRVLNVPHNISSSSIDFYKRELKFFKESLEKFTGREIDNEHLSKTIELYDENRKLVRRLYDLRKEDPPLMSSVEMLHLLVAGVSIDPKEFNTLLRETTEEVTTRACPVKGNLPRILLYGCIVDNDFLFGLIESSGANLVVDDTCIGTRTYSCEVGGVSDPLGGLARCYFHDFVCPRTVREGGDAA